MKGIILNDLLLLANMWRQRVMPKPGKVATQSLSRGIKYQMYFKWRRDVAKGSILYTFLLSKCVAPQERDGPHLFTTHIFQSLSSQFLFWE